MRKAFLLSRELLIQETHHQIHFNASAVRVHNGKENRGLGELRNNSLIRLKKQEGRFSQEDSKGASCSVHLDLSHQCLSPCELEQVSLNLLVVLQHWCLLERVVCFAETELTKLLLFPQFRFMNGLRSQDAFYPFVWVQKMWCFSRCWRFFRQPLAELEVCIMKCIAYFTLVLQLAVLLCFGVFQLARL